jgi:very-short-patch-repair endonuclease
MTKREAIFDQYLEELKLFAQPGDAREESFYPALENLIRKVASVLGRHEIRVTPQPRPTEAGNPDFRVWDGTSRIVGYIEAKPPTEELLDRIEDSEQLQRYRSTFPNLILTNFLEFRLYRDGQRVAVAQLGRPRVLTSLHQTPPLENPDAVWALLDQFLGFSLPRPLTAENLAVELAKRTRFLRDIVRQQLKAVQDRGQGLLLGFYEAFQKFLIGSLTPEEFADLYAQTVTYGLFAARTRAANGFSRRAAFDYIPHTVGVLRDLFRYLSLSDLPEEMAWIVDDIAEVLAVADVSGMMLQYYREGKGSDPVVHFYETFLAHYNPEERERRGVYYTPDPVVFYIVLSLHRLLQEKFDISDGLASEKVTLLDPAAGTMSFVARSAELAVKEFQQKYGSGGREEFIRKHILQNFYAFELMMAPYAVGHLKMAFFLEELGHRLEEGERIPFYLTNTLDMTELEASKLPGLSSLAEESHLAGRVKREQPILVILGNPPYSGHSANKGEWIQRQIEVYKQVDGKPLGEKNPKWLQDDYVKFIRFAQWKIEQMGRGLIGMITNHAYLDNPTFRGMRRSLMQTFDEIYVLDLHGNSLKRERCPDGSPDENVFDIRQGVAIAFFVKTGGRAGTEARVFHADLWGSRRHKYEWLKSNDISTTRWTEVQPKPEFYLFVPRDETFLAQYETFPSITSIFLNYQTGIIAGRDSLAIQFTKEEMWRTVLNFSQMDPELARQAYNLGKDARDWKVRQAQEDLRKSGLSKDRIVPILYRPFDIRYTYYTGNNKGFLRWAYPQFMRHMLAGENVGIVFVRQVKASHSWHHCFVSSHIVESCLVSNHTSEIGYIAPLYLYPDTERGDLFGSSEPRERQPNLNPTLLAALQAAYDPTPVPPPYPTPVSPPRERGGDEGEGLDSPHERELNYPTPVPPPRTRGGGQGEGFDSPRTRGGGQGEGYWHTPPHLWEKLKPLARQMRKSPTPAENQLWQHLRGKQLLGYKFRRQHAIERFIVDFYCHKARLIVEIDGPIHQYTPEEDAIRQEFLESLGFRVLRFTNEQVMTNIDGVLEKIAEALRQTKAASSITPEQVFHYIYAVLYAPSYREKYADFLRLDFPRIPFPADREVFEAMAELGARLVDLHLLRAPELDPPLARFEGQGDNRIVKSGRKGFRYEAQTERVYINSTQYFAPVPPEVWEYAIGGYQVCQKWLKDRKNRALSLEEIQTYLRILTSLKYTLELTEEIEELYIQIDGETLPIALEEK